jgi:hypothetical protein
MYINTLNIGKRKEAELYLNRILKDMEKHTPYLYIHIHIYIYIYTYIYIYILYIGK